jgi:hypothetical protein
MVTNHRVTLRRYGAALKDHSMNGSEVMSVLVNRISPAAGRTEAAVDGSPEGTFRDFERATKTRRPKNAGRLESGAGRSPSRPTRQVLVWCVWNIEVGLAVEWRVID